MDATERLASFVEQTRFEKLPPEVVTAAKREAPRSSEMGFSSTPKA